MEGAQQNLAPSSNTGNANTSAGMGSGINDIVNRPSGAPSNIPPLPPPAEAMTAEWKTPPPAASEPVISNPVPPISNPAPATPNPVLAEPTRQQPITTPVPETASLPTSSPKTKVFGKVVLSFFIAFVLVVCLLTGLTFADDKGWLSTGISPRVAFIPISKAWGALSADPAAASEQMSIALKKLGSYTINGAFSGYGQQTDVTDSQNLSTTNISTSANQSTVPDPLSQTYTFTLTTSRQNYSLQNTVNDNNIEVQSEYRVIDGDLYIRNDFGTVPSSAAVATGSESVWVKAGKAPTYTTDSVRENLVSKLSLASWIGAEKVGSEPTYHFRVAIRGSDIPIFTATDTELDWKKSNGSLDLWLSRKNHLPLQVKASMKLENVGASIAMTATLNSNQRAENIVVPEDAIDPTVSLTADTRRKSDLGLIAAALEQYKQAVGTYPVATSLERLNESDTSLVKALVPAYLNAMPTDPNTSRYYGYVSNGTTYELSAVLDDANDPTGTKSGSLTLYLVKNTDQQLDISESGL